MKQEWLIDGEEVGLDFLVWLDLSALQTWIKTILFMMTVFTMVSFLDHLKVFNYDVTVELQNKIQCDVVILWCIWLFEFNFILDLN